MFPRARLHNSQTFVKFDSKQQWKNKGEKFARLFCRLHEKDAFMILQAVVVLSKFVRPSILNSSGYVISHMGNIEHNLK